jgi:hypothetical protein
VLLLLLFDDVKVLDDVKGTKYYSNKFFDYLKSLDLKYVEPKNDDRQCKKFNFTREERLRFYNNIDDLDIFGESFYKNNEKGMEKRDLFENFNSIYKNMTNNTYNNGDELSIISEKWMNDFLKIYAGAHVTPYMHIFGSHMSLYKINLNKYTLQGFERFIGLTKRYYFTKTNRNKDWLKQLLCAQIRKENILLDSKSYLNLTI